MFKKLNSIYFFLMLVALPSCLLESKIEVTRTSAKVIGSNISITNFINNQDINTGFLLGTAAITNDILSYIEVSFDGADWESVTGTSSWTIKLPCMLNNSSSWKRGSSHTIVLRILNPAGAELYRKTYQVKKGINKDFNGDGYADLVVGAAYSDEVGTDRGAVYIYHGGSSGVSASATQTLLYPGSDDTAFFGGSVASAGDVNGDGYADLIVGASSSDEAGTDRGVAYIYHGSSSGISASATQTLLYPGSNDAAFFGGSVASVGDVNGDGYTDIIVGAKGTDGAGTRRGAAYIYHGTSSGISASATQTLSYPGGDDSSGFGNSVAGGGDLNGDGYADLIVGANSSNIAGTDRGAAYVYHGSSSGVSATATQTLLYPASDDTAFYGGSVASAGDLNADGYADLIVGANASDEAGTDRGAAYIYHGTSSGVSTTATQTLLYPASDDSARFGVSVSSAGDVNGDGYTDLLVGARNSNEAGTSRGATYIYHGASSGVSATATQTLLYSGSDDSARFGISVSGAGDLNGDGHGDLIIGAYLSDEVGTDRGAAYTYHGASSGISASATHSLLYPGSDDSAYFGFSVN
jgi:hypothetical protein